MEESAALSFLGVEPQVNLYPHQVNPVPTKQKAAPHCAVGDRWVSSLRSTVTSLKFHAYPAFVALNLFKLKDTTNWKTLTLTFSFHLSQLLYVASCEFMVKCARNLAFHLLLAAFKNDKNVSWGHAAFIRPFQPQSKTKKSEKRKCIIVAILLFNDAKPLHIWWKRI